MATVTYKGSGKLLTTDFKSVKWTGKTKAGNAVEITLTDAINLGNIDWAFAEKDDTVAEVEFTATYDNTDSMVSADADLVEPWSVKYTSGTSDTASAGILLGAGVLSVGSNAVALTRGGGSFTVEREFRNINADGDRGPVKDRIVMDGATAKLKVNALTFLANMADLYPALTTTTT